MKPVRRFAFLMPFYFLIHSTQIQGEDLQRERPCVGVNHGSSVRRVCDSHRRHEAQGNENPPLESTFISSDEFKNELKKFLKEYPGATTLITEFLTIIEGINKATLSYRDPRVAALVIKLGGELSDLGILGPLVEFIARTAYQTGKLPNTITSDNLDRYIKQAITAFEAELTIRGATQKASGAKYKDWASLSLEHMNEIRSLTQPILQGHRVSGFDIPEFIRVFERETGGKFGSGSTVKLLVDGPASFRERENLISQANRSIHVMSWAFYDDKTGEYFADQLIQKKRNAKSRGLPIDIRVMVDGQIAELPEHDTVLGRMEAEGIEVLRWRNPDPIHAYDGQHRKIFVVDGSTSIEGGMNFGDPYSHMAGSTKWRDTDIAVSGNGAFDADQLFTRIWNEQLHRRGHIIDGKTLSKVTSSEKSPMDDRSSPRTTLIDHAPGTGEKILRANLMAIEAAKSTIEIENAYFILVPAVYHALLRAKNRGVTIRILTNSAESIDVPEMSHQILRSVNRLVEKGIEVYLKRGDTLHSKFMNVDGIYSWVGSYNFHPRSDRYEGEVIRAVIDKEFGAQVREVFANDIALAEKISKPAPLPKNLVAELLGFWFFDQL